VEWGGSRHADLIIPATHLRRARMVARGGQGTAEGPAVFA
jgi:hypothetical protein